MTASATIPASTQRKWRIATNPEPMAIAAVCGAITNMLAAAMTRPRNADGGLSWRRVITLTA